MVKIHGIHYHIVNMVNQKDIQSAWDEFQETMESLGERQMEVVRNFEKRMVKELKKTVVETISDQIHE
jgi:hypothetical protein